MSQINYGLRTWTLDEVAECLSISETLSAKLWGFLGECTNRTPQGGDGSNGTVEEPSSRLDPDNDDKLPHWWDKLTPAEQAEINNAYDHVYGDTDQPKIKVIVGDGQVRIVANDDIIDGVTRVTKQFLSEQCGFEFEETNDSSNRSTIGTTERG